MVKFFALASIVRRKLSRGLVELSRQLARAAGFSLADPHVIQLSGPISFVLVSQAPPFKWGFNKLWALVIKASAQATWRNISLMIFDAFSRSGTSPVIRSAYRNDSIIRVSE